MNWILWAFTPFAPNITFTQSDVDGVNVSDAFKKCREEAIKIIGSEDLQCVGWNWQQNWLGTAWWSPPPPQET